MASRVVVTGFDAEGRSVVTSDRVVAPRSIGEPALISVSNLAASDTMVTAQAVVPEPDETFFPPAGGLRVAVLEWAPGTVRPEMSPEAYAAQREEVLRGYDATATTTADGLHATPTIDVGWVLEGELTLELSDGATTVLSNGDTVVQNATAHRWWNASDKLCRALFVMVGLKGEVPPELG